MKPEGHTLFRLAEGDRKAFYALVDADIPFPSACFHAQQAIEKYIKSLLAAKGVKYPFTHDLIELHATLADNGIHFVLTDAQLAKLNPFAVKARYDLLPEVLIDAAEVKSYVDEVAIWCKNLLIEIP